jgi:hypothetical protein
MIYPAQFYKSLSFYLGVPLALGIIFGFSRVGTMAHLFPKPVSIVYWCSMVLVLWTLHEICSRLVARALKPWRPPLWLIVLPGAILQTSIGGFYIGMHQRFFMGFLATPNTFKPISVSIETVLTDFPHLLMQNAGPIALWVGVNYFFDRLAGLPRFRYEAAEPLSAPAAPGIASFSPLESQAVHDATQASAVSSPSSPIPAVSASSAPASARSLPAAPSRLYGRLPDSVKGEILAISALDHYLQILTDKGSATLHGRLVDAVCEMPSGQGWQVHRSHWVHRSAIRRLLVEQQRYSLERIDGTVVPVSSRYVELLKAAGFKPHAVSTRKGDQRRLEVDQSN